MKVVKEGSKTPWGVCSSTGVPMGWELGGLIRCSFWGSMAQKRKVVKIGR